MDQRIRRAGLGLLLFLSLCLNALLLLTEKREAPSADSPVGTYSTVDTFSPAAADGLYLALDQNGAYCLYRQGEELETGRYTESGPVNCYVLSPANDAGSGTQLIWTGKSVYWLSPEGIVFFSRFSDIPTHISIS